MVSQELNDIVKKSFNLYFKEYKLFIAIGILSVIPLLIVSTMVFVNLFGTILMLITAGLANIFAYMIYVLATKHYTENKLKHKKLTEKNKAHLKHKLNKKAHHHIKKSFLPLIGTMILIQLILLAIILGLGLIIGGIYLALLALMPSTVGSLIVQIIFITIGIISISMTTIYAGIHLFFGPVITVLEEISPANAIKKSIKTVREKFSERFVTILAIKIIGIVISLGILMIFSPFEIINITSIKEGIHLISIVIQQLATIPIIIMGTLYYMNIIKSKKEIKKTTKKKTIKKKSTKKKTVKKTTKNTKKKIVKKK